MAGNKALEKFKESKIPKKGKGKITILFDNEEQLEQIMNALDGAHE